jgi:hypothetical protein
MNKRIYIAKYARKCLDASIRRALGKDGMEKLARKETKIVCLDGEWWLLSMSKQKKDDDNA